MTLRLFIVDGSCQLQQALIETLADLQLARCVGSAVDLEQAKQWLRTHAQGWDVMVLEPRLQEGNGLVLLELCRHRSAGQRVLVLTHHATDAMRQYSLSQGADAVFDKGSQLVAFIGHLGQLKQAQAVSR